MFSCLQIVEAFLWFVLIALLNVTLIILALGVSTVFNVLFRLPAVLLCMFSGIQMLEAFLWFVLITVLNVTLIILTLSVSRLLNLLLRLVAFLLFLNPQCLASISRWITASSSWKRFCLFVCRALSSIMVI